MTITVEEKDPDVPQTYEIDTRDRFVPEVNRSYEYAVDDVVRFGRDNGFYLKCTKAGISGRYNPYSPREANQQIRDGSVEWVSVRPADATVPVISTVAWTVGDLTLDSQEETDHIARATVSGGKDGQDYEVTARITPDVGDAIDVTLTIPVRDQ